jgi:hypothetical protein
MFEAAFASLASVCERTRQELASYRAQRPGDDDTAFLEQSVKEFIKAGREVEDPRPGLRMMALSVYALVNRMDEVSRLRERVAYLEDQLDMRGQALEISWNKIDELESAQA